jgi:hypothetical protein
MIDMHVLMNFVIFHSGSVNILGFLVSKFHFLSCSFRKLINQHQETFMRLLTEPIEEPVHGETDRGVAERIDDRRGMTTQPSHSQPPVHYVQITQEEKEAIDRVSI